GAGAASPPRGSNERVGYHFPLDQSSCSTRDRRRGLLPGDGSRACPGGSAGSRIVLMSAGEPRRGEGTAQGGFFHYLRAPAAGCQSSMGATSSPRPCGSAAGMTSEGSLRK